MEFEYIVQKGCWLDLIPQGGILLVLVIYENPLQLEPINPDLSQVSIISI